MEDKSRKPTVGFIGLGTMGIEMAKNILKHGYPLVVWNRNCKKYENHPELSAKLATTPKDLTEKSDVIISMLATPVATKDVILGRGKWRGIGVMDGINARKVIVDMSTNLPSEVRGIAEDVEKKGGEFIDAPVLGSVTPASKGSLTILAAGKKEVIDEVKPILTTMGKKIWHVGNIGMGSTMKLTLNLHLNIVMGAFAESLALGTKAGLDPVLIVKILNNSIFKTYVTKTKAKQVLNGDWTPTFTVELALKDTHLASELAREVSAPVLLGGIVKQLYSSVKANGKESSDYSSLITAYEQLGNVRISKPTS